LKAGYSYDELAGLNPKDRLRVITRRYLLIAYLFTGIALLLYLLSVVRVVPEYLNLTREMDKKTEELHKRIDEERERSTALARGLEHVTGAGEAIADHQMDADVLRLTTELKQLLSRYDNTFPESSYPNAVKARIQILSASADLADLEERLKYPIKVSDGPIRLGPYDALIDIVMFIDYEGAFSVRGLQTLETIMQKFSGNVKISVRHNALDIHPCSKLMAIAAIAASRQEKFWTFTRALLYDFQKVIRSGDTTCRAGLDRAAEAAGLDLSWFGRDLLDPSLAQLVDIDTKTASEMGIGSPTFFLNGVILPGARSQKDFEDIIYRLAPRLRVT
jgi:predicted DsbA family dithiol-disulfide isomerase